MSDVFTTYGDPNDWYTLPGLGYIYSPEGEDLLYDLAVEDGFMDYVLDAIKEKYNGGN